MSPLFKAATALVLIAGTSAVMLTAKPAAPTGALASAVAASHRSEANRARDKYRNPVQTLNFFGVKPHHKVVELWPGGGWYTEILAPYLAASGELTVAPPLPRTDRIKTVLAANPAVYGKVSVATFPMAEGGTAVSPGSADVVLTFRNVHNWRFDGADAAQTSFNAIFAMLKPGGVLGVVDHRLPENMDTKLEEKSGYMKRSSILAYAKRAGFRLAGESAINANPKDTHDWEKGVWTLPPVYRLGETDKAKYAAIGESDRLTMKFVKPKK
jgi:predicted methyltransferase